MPLQIYITDANATDLDPVVMTVEFIDNQNCYEEEYD